MSVDVLPVCRVCGCTDSQACVFEWDGEPHTCYWIEPDLCSECADEPIPCEMRDGVLTEAPAAPPLLYDAYGGVLVR